MAFVVPVPPDPLPVPVPVVLPEVFPVDELTGFDGFTASCVHENKTAKNAATINRGLFMVW